MIHKEATNKLTREIAEIEDSVILQKLEKRIRTMEFALLGSTPYSKWASFLSYPDSVVITSDHELHRIHITTRHRDSSCEFTHYVASSVDLGAMLDAVIAAFEKNHSDVDVGNFKIDLAAIEKSLS